MDLFTLLFGGAAQKASLAALKLGKTEEQKEVIDYFMKEGGCGCLGNASHMTVDRYNNDIVARKCEALNLRERAIQKINLDESQISEIPPIMMNSYVYSKDPDVYWKYDNGYVVTSRFAVTWIFFSAEQIYTYKYIFNTTSDDTVEKTEDIYYRDITDMATRTENIEHIDIVNGCPALGCLSKDKGVKTVFSYSGFQIKGAGFDLYYEMNSSPVLEQSIQAAKACWREKKFIAQQK